jgi:hypothetical protein
VNATNFSSSLDCCLTIAIPVSASLSPSLFSLFPFLSLPRLLSLPRPLCPRPLSLSEGVSLCVSCSSTHTQGHTNKDTTLTLSTTDLPAGLIHSCYELYGPQKSEELLSVLGRLFVIYLQSAAHTCGMDDLVLVPEAEAERSKILDNAAHSGIAATARFLDLAASRNGGVVTREGLQAELKSRILKAKMEGADDSLGQGASVAQRARLVRAQRPLEQQHPKDNRRLS